MCLAVALLGLACSPPTASAQGSLCQQITKVIKVGQTFYGHVCQAVTYTTINGQKITTTTCACEATNCPHLCPKPGGGVTICWQIVSAYCHPNFLVKSP
jgi:hypothetical protein